MTTGRLSPEGNRARVDTEVIRMLPQMGEGGPHIVDGIHVGATVGYDAVFDTGDDKARCGNVSTYIERHRPVAAKERSTGKEDDQRKPVSRRGPQNVGLQLTRLPIR